MSFTKITEQDSLYNNLESKSVRELLDDINTEDQKVASAVRKTIPKVKELVLQIVPRMKQGGRIFIWVPAQVDVWAYSMLRRSPLLSECRQPW